MYKRHRSAKKKRGHSLSNNKKKRTSTGSVANLLPHHNKPPGPPCPYDRQKSAPSAHEEVESTVKDSSTQEKESADVKVQFLDIEVGQKLSDQEIFVYADAVACKRSIGSICINKAMGDAIIDPIQGSDKPVGSSLNDGSSTNIKMHLLNTLMLAW
jgi:hypothetical protein